MFDPPLMPQRTWWPSPLGAAKVTVPLVPERPLSNRLTTKVRHMKQHVRTPRQASEQQQKSY